MKLAEYINDMKPDFHKFYGAKYGFEIGQSEAHMDLTLNATTQYLQKLLMSGKMKEIQNLAMQGSFAMKDSLYYDELLQSVVTTYYGLSWDNERKTELAEDILTFMIDGLKHRFNAGGYKMDKKGVMDFLGVDLGILGKMGGMFSKFF